MKLNFLGIRYGTCWAGREGYKWTTEMPVTKDVQDKWVIKCGSTGAAHAAHEASINHCDGIITDTPL